MWQDEWPTEPGLWWFYGYPWRKLNKDDKPNLYLVRVRTISNGTAYVLEGHFFFKGESGIGKWQKVTLPELPKEETPEG